MYQKEEYTKNVEGEKYMLGLDFLKLDGYSTRESIMRDLRSDGKPVIIYGTGKFAVSVAEMLVNNDIKLYGFVDEEKYYYSDKIMHIKGMDYPCWLLEEIELPRTEYNVLLGNIEFDRIEECRKIFRGCKIIEYLDACNSHIIRFDFLREKADILAEIYEVLQDSQSKDVLEAYLHARYTGDVKALSELKYADALYDWKLLNISEKDILVDGGAFVGDGIKEIQRLQGFMPQEVFCFEPDEYNMIKLLHNFSPEELRKIHPIMAGLYCEDTVLEFSSTGTLGSAVVAKGNREVKVQALDNHSAYSNVNVIKMDIEGSEVAALKGAYNLIKANKPRLAISIYHKTQDIIDIFEFLKEFDYKIFLRHHSSSVEETVLYAV